MNDDMVDVFLEHYGVRGMHWGQRKANKIAKDNVNRHYKRKRENKTFSRSEKRKVVGTGIALGGVAGLLSRNMGMSLPGIAVVSGSIGYAGAALTRRTLLKNGKKKVSELPG